MIQFTTTLHITLCIVLILIILLQPGKDSGAVFGGQGGGNKNYAARSNGHPLSKATTFIAVIFMFTSITLAWFSSSKASQDSNVQDAISAVQNENQSQEAVVFAIPKLPNVRPSDLGVVAKVSPDAAIMELNADGNAQENNSPGITLPKIALARKKA